MTNVDTKIFYKAKAVLSGLISSQQTTYITYKFVGKIGRLISDRIESSDWLILKGF